MLLKEPGWSRKAGLGIKMLISFQTLLNIPQYVVMMLECMVPFKGSYTWA